MPEQIGVFHPGSSLPIAWEDLWHWQFIWSAVPQCLGSKDPSKPCMMEMAVVANRLLRALLSPHFLYLLPLCRFAQCTQGAINLPPISIPPPPSSSSCVVLHTLESRSGVVRGGNASLQILGTWRACAMPTLGAHTGCSIPNMNTAYWLFDHDFLCSFGMEFLSQGVSMSHSLPSFLNKQWSFNLSGLLIIKELLMGVYEASNNIVG